MSATIPSMPSGLRIPFGTLERAARMTPEQQAQLIDRNRQRYSIDREQPRPAAADPGTPPSDVRGTDEQDRPQQLETPSGDWRS